jgi:hypothetical protein
MGATKSLNDERRSESRVVETAVRERDLLAEYEWKSMLESCGLEIAERAAD